MGPGLPSPVAGNWSSRSRFTCKSLCACAQSSNLWPWPRLWKANVLLEGPTLLESLRASRGRGGRDLAPVSASSLVLPAGSQGCSASYRQGRTGQERGGACWSPRAPWTVPGDARRAAVHGGGPRCPRQVGPPQHLLVWVVPGQACPLRVRAGRKVTQLGQASDHRMGPVHAAHLAPRGQAGVCEVPGQTGPAPGRRRGAEGGRGGGGHTPGRSWTPGTCALAQRWGGVWAPSSARPRPLGGDAAHQAAGLAEGGRAAPSHRDLDAPPPVTGHRIHDSSLGTQGSGLRPSQPEAPLVGDASGLLRSGSQAL